MYVMHSTGSVRSPPTLVIIKGQFFENRKNPIENLVESNKRFIYFAISSLYTIHKNEDFHKTFSFTLLKILV